MDGYRVPTPNSEKIRQRATELYFKDNPTFSANANIPEDNELKEEGYWITARNELMGVGKLDALVHEEESKVSAEQEKNELDFIKNHMNGEPVTEEQLSKLSPEFIRTHEAIQKRTLEPEIIDTKSVAEKVKQEQEAKDAEIDAKLAEITKGVDNLMKYSQEATHQEEIKELTEHPQLTEPEAQTIAIQHLEEQAAETPPLLEVTEITPEIAEALSINDICCEACVYAENDVKLCKCKCNGKFHGKGNAHKGEDEATLIKNIVEEEKQNPFVRPQKEEKPKKTNQPLSKKETTLSQTKKPKSESEGTYETLRTQVSKGYLPACMELIKLEISGGRSSGMLAFAGSVHLNDFLHSAGLITDDAWNAVKGVATLFSETANAATLVNLATSTLKTLVEAGESIATTGANVENQKAQTEKLLAGVYTDVEP